MAKVSYYYRVVLFLSFMLAGLATEGMSAPSPLAMVTDLQGQAILIRDGNDAPCDILSYLQDGDELKSLRASVVTIVYLQNGKEYRLENESHIRISKTGVDVLDNSNIKSRVLKTIKESGLQFETIHNYGQGTIIFRGIEKKKKITLLEPVDTKVASSSPVFKWESGLTTKEFKFTLLNYESETIFSSKTTNNYYPLPQNIHLNDEEPYSWTVESQGDSAGTISSTGNFRVIEKTKRDLVKKLRPGSNANFSERVIYAGFLDHLGLNQLAKGYWQALQRERPESISLKQTTR